MKRCIPYTLDLSQSLYGGSSQVIFNGFIHWIGKKKILPVPRLIVSFNLSNEEFNVIQLPPPAGQKHVSLGVLKEYFGLVAWWSNEPVEVWVMKEYGISDSWTKELVIPMVEVPRVLGFGIGGQNLIYATSDSVVWCDLEISLHGIPQGRKNTRAKHSFILQSVPYVQSLLPLGRHRIRKKRGWSEYLNAT